MTLAFTPFPPIRAFHDKPAIHAMLEDVATSTERLFVSGLMGGHSVRIYMRRGRSHQASAPGEYPANDSGALRGSTGHTVTATEAQIGTNAPHSVFLAHGTSTMARRNYVDTALKETAPAALHRMRHFAEYKRGSWPA